MPSEFYIGVCEERIWDGGRGIAIAGTVTRKRPVTDWKHQTVYSANCKLWK
jgi:hypothetical protein